MRRRTKVETLMILAVLVIAAGGRHLFKVSRSPRPNVLWITMDSLRADHLGCTGHGQAHTPSIDALARQSALFTGNISQSTYTRISVPSMITGKYPLFSGLRKIYGDLDSSHVTLAEALAADGYSTYAIAEPWPVSFFQGLETSSTGSSATARKTRRFLEIMSQLDDRPFFIWLYYWDPHLPYTPPAAFSRLCEIDNGQEADVSRVATGFGSGSMLLHQLNQGKTVLTQAEKNHLMNLYDAEIAFVDSKIKEVVEKIKELGLWDNTMVVLNADHGEAFGEHGRYYHGHTIYEEEVRVPLIVKPPRSLTEEKIIDGPVRNLDIMPTILDYCGIAAPADIQGQSLRPYVQSELSPNLPGYIETHSPQSKSHLMAYRDGHYKLIYNLPGGANELYDLRTDPGEKNNLLAKETTAQGQQDSAMQLEAQLRERLVETLGVEAISSLRLEVASDVIDPESVERLKALGYIY